VELYLAIVTGFLYAIGLYLMLRRSVVRLVIGLAVISHGANLLIFTSASVTRGRAPLIGDEGAPSLEMVADPLPQALILTAIVISFAVLGFALVLARRACLMAGTDDVDEYRASES
jgi:multicomponent Na+:H+ antiporter subunit C